MWITSLGVLVVGLANSFAQLLPTNAPNLARQFTNVARQVSVERPRPLVTSGRQLRDLPIPEAQRHYPVSIQGVVTYFDPQFKVMFVQDETAGFWIYKTFQGTNYHAGQLLELKGVTDAVYGPAMRARDIKVLGTAPLPKPYPVTYDRLASGREDCQRVAAEGVVRTMAVRGGILKIDLAAGNEHIPLYLPGFASRPMPTNLIGSEVEAHGVCSMKVNGEGQLVGFWFYVQDTNDLFVLRQGAADPFTLATTPVKNVWMYNHRRPGEQTRIYGTVTFSSADRLYVRDETGSLQVRLRAPWVRDDDNGRYHDPIPAVPVKPGDIVDVVGYLSPEFAPVLVDAEYRRVQSGVSPAPRPLRIEQALQNSADAELVTIDARLVDSEMRRSVTRTEQVLVLQAKGTIFEAIADMPSSPIKIAPQSLVRVTGVNSVQVDRWKKGRSFQLLLRSNDDVAVLKASPRWNSGDVARIGGSAVIMLVATVAWILILRRQIAARTRELVATNEKLTLEIAEREQVAAELRRAQEELHSALAKERELGQLKSNFVNLVSHEFRTPLGVILSSSEILDSYLESLSPSERAEHMRDIKECTRYMSGLMEDVLVLGRVEAGKIQFRPITLNISEFCQRLIDETLSATHRVCPIEFFEEGLNESSARGDESMLRHIFNNLLSNAVKYSKAGSCVRFSVARDGGDAVFCVRDTGIGIPPEDLKNIFTSFHRGRNVGQLPGSGLGLVIVKRCVDLHGGSIDIQSVEGLGTSVIVRLPLFVRTGHTDFFRK